MTAPARRRVVVVSNRVPPRADGAPRSVGGLVSAVRPALEGHGGLWFGWSGETGDPDADPEHWSDAGIDYVTVDLDPVEVEHYYEGFCNRTLWPLMHGMPERAHLEPGEDEVWLRVNARFARRLLPYLRSGDLVWVHDYQLIPLGEELRLAGWEGAIGYFHHIPIPEQAAWEAIPNASDLHGLFRGYDLVGLQTERDRLRLASHIREDVPTLAVLPIGIDPGRIRAVADEHPDDPFEAVRRGRQVVFGLDRLDYTKGVPDRLDAFAALLEDDPWLADAAVIAQWSAPSREGIREYQEERQRVEDAAERVRAAAPSALAIDLRIAVMAPPIVAAGLRDADVCLVTSVADGMNLVAKEFVAVQRERRPGVLVLTDGCGAAEELTEAVIVPSGDVYALGRAIRLALAMPLQERVERWRAMRATVEEGDAARWCARFLALLEVSSEDGHNRAVV